MYKTEADSGLKTRNSVLEVIIQAILNLPEEEVPDLVRQIRTCESLDSVAEALLAKETSSEQNDEDLETEVAVTTGPSFETQLSRGMGELRLEDGSTRYIGGTSNLIFLGNGDYNDTSIAASHTAELYQEQADAVISWTNVTDDAELVQHLLAMYFNYHYTFFCCLSKRTFWREFLRGKQPAGSRRDSVYCTPLLVNAMLALGCHFTAWRGARADPDDSATAGDHFFQVRRV